MTALRYGVLALTVGLFLSGSILALSLLDPFSNFGRIAGDLLRPFYVVAHNGVGSLLEALGLYGPFPLSWKMPPLATLAFPALFLVGLIWLSAWHGRMFCNTLCPVGALLGLVSRFALFKIRIPKDACIVCVQCSTHCKAGCIRLKTKDIDFSRCVACFNCITVCEAHGIGYARSAPTQLHLSPPAPLPQGKESRRKTTPALRATPPYQGRGITRRALLQGAATALVGWAALPGCGAGRSQAA